MCDPHIDLADYFFPVTDYTGLRNDLMLIIYLSNEIGKCSCEMSDILCPGNFFSQFRLDALVSDGMSETQGQEGGRGRLPFPQLPLLLSRQRSRHFGEGRGNSLWLLHNYSFFPGNHTFVRRLEMSNRNVSHPCKIIIPRILWGKPSDK